jgi:SAM-dependent methyltransferase
VTSNETERQRWNDAEWAEQWPKRERLTDEVTPFLLDALALQGGEHVLDVGCGGARTAIAAAARVGDKGSVVGADISAPLLVLASHRAAGAGARNLSFVEADMQTDALSVPGAGFDVAMSQFGVMFFDEPVTAFANIGTHLRPGGRIGFACWQSVDRNPWFVGPVVAPFLPPPPDPAPEKSVPGPFAFADPGRVTEILGASGYSDFSRSDHELVVSMPLDVLMDDWQMRFNGIPEDAMDKAQAVVSRYLSQFGEPGAEGRFPIAFQIFTARR